MCCYNSGCLDCYLYNIENNRAAVEKCLDDIDILDCWQLYYKLLVDCRNILTSEELECLECRVKSLFDSEYLAVNGFVM